MHAVYANSPPISSRISKLRVKVFDDVDIHRFLDNHQQVVTLA